MSDFVHTRQIMMQLTGPEGEYPVAQQMIDGIEYPVFTTAAPNLPALFQICLQHGDLDFVVCGDDRFSFSETYFGACRVAHLLKARGITKGDRVAVAMRNRPEWIISYMGALMAGAIVVPMNSWWTGPELDFGLQDCGAKLVFLDRSRLRRLQETRNDTPFISAGGFEERDNELTRLIAEFPPEPLPFDHLLPDDDASIMYTSGSTGQPKGAVSTHRAIITTLMAWVLSGVATQVYQGTFGREAKRQLAVLATLPLFHVTGCHGQLLCSIILGRKLVLLRSWVPEEAARLIEQEHVTNFSGVPTMSMELMNVALEGRYDLSSLEDLMAGGAARPPDQVRRLREVFPNARPQAGYGLTESNAIGTLNGLDDYMQKPASVGPPTAPLVEMEIRDPDGKVLPAGEPGEICIHSAANIRAYWNRPEDSSSTLSGGWLRTGDVGYLDEEGFLFIVDRIKDIVIRGGENISCIEVESAISTHGSVHEAAVFSVPHARLGETAAAAVFVTPGDRVSGADIQNWLEGKLAKFKIPEYVLVVQEQLPRLASGKLDKRGSREMLLSHFEIEA
jgi:acyl-CoA synthetase (AMP-forming)/AMP-acid ligase II